jgi:hypothetical protein
MLRLFYFFLAILASPFKSKSRLEAEKAALRHQLIVLRRRAQSRVRLTNSDRWFLIQLYRWFPSILQVVAIVQPETLVPPGRLSLNSRYGHTRQTHRTSLTLAERLRPARVCGSYRGLGRGGLRQILRAYARYYNNIRTHRSLDKDAPAFRSVQRVGTITSYAILGGLHHRYVRV